MEAAIPPATSTASSGTWRFTRASAIGVPHGCAAPPHGAAVALDLGSRHGQLRLGAVQVQQHEPARRPPEVPDPRDALLPAVAALVEVDRRREPADLLRDRLVVGVE